MKLIWFQTKDIQTWVLLNHCKFASNLKIEIQNNKFICNLYAEAIASNSPRTYCLTYLYILLRTVVAHLNNLTVSPGLESLSKPLYTVSAASNNPISQSHLTPFYIFKLSERTLTAFQNSSWQYTGSAQIQSLYPQSPASYSCRALNSLLSTKFKRFLKAHTSNYHYYNCCYLEG